MTIDPEEGHKIASRDQLPEIGTVTRYTGLIGWSYNGLF